MAHVLLIDDDAALSAMLTLYLAGKGFQTTAVYDGEDGIRAACQSNFDAIILDVMLPTIGGLEVLRRIRQQSIVPILMLTAKGDDADRVLGLDTGADDYIAKPYNPKELVARLNAMLRRQALDKGGPRGPLAAKGLELTPASREVTFEGALLDLTVSEFNMLEALLRAKDLVASKDDLSFQVLGRQRASYDRSVDVHVSNLRKKLSAATTGKAEIETIRGVGYRLRIIQ